jgi:hypothetical protein
MLGVESPLPTTKVASERIEQLKGRFSSVTRHEPSE